jgi:hypothetical protein
MIMRSEYFDPLERFRERMDQLLDAINRVCCILMMSYRFILVDF